MHALLKLNLATAAERSNSMANEIPAALSPVAPEAVPAPQVTNIGGPADVAAAKANVDAQAAIPYAQRQYDYYNKMFSEPQYNLAPEEREDWILRHVQRDVNVQNSDALKSQAAAQAEQTKIAERNAKREALGLAPLPVPGQQEAANPAVVPLNENDFAINQPQQPAGSNPFQMPSEYGGLMGTFNTQQKANTAIAKAQADLATLQETELAKQEDFYKEQIQRQQKMQADFDSAFKERTAYLDDISKQMASQDFTAPKLDKDRLWNSRSTGQKIMAGIAMFLGAAGGAMTGKSNQALDVMNNAIDKDIEQQKFDIQQAQQTKQMKLNNLKDQAGLQQNMLSHLTQKFGNDMQAESALRVLMTQQLQTKLASLTANTESKTVLEKAKILNAQLEQQKLQAAMAFKAQVAQQQALKNLGTQDMSNLSPADLARLPKEYRDAIEKHQERTVPGIGLALDPEAAKKARSIKAASDGLITTIDRILELRKSASAHELANPYSEKYKELESLSGTLLGQTKDASELGALDNGVQMLVDKIHKNPTGFNPAIDKTYQANRKMQIVLTQRKLGPYVGDSSARKYSGPGAITNGLNSLKPKN